MEDTLLRLLYSNALGRWLLCLLLKLGLPKLMSRYLNSRLSRKLIPKYIEKHNIAMQIYPKQEYRSFADFFARRKRCPASDPAPTHFSSPCDGLLSAYPIDWDRGFQIKGSRYRVCDLVNDPSVAESFIGGTCLIFRLTAADCHRYSFPDDGYICEHHFIEGTLHSVQPIACDTFPVYRLNRRCWAVLETAHFGKIVQIEVGALAVGGIKNEKQNAFFQKGEEKGHFTLCGSTIVLLVQKNRIQLLPDINAAVREGREYRVLQGDWIATQADTYRPEEQTEHPEKTIFYSSKED